MMKIFSRKRRLTESQRVVLSAFLFGGVLCALFVMIFCSARHPCYYTSEPTNEEMIHQEIVNQVLSG